MKKIFLINILILSITNILAYETLNSKAYDKGKLMGYAVAAAITIQSELIANTNLYSNHKHNCNVKLNQIDLIKNNTDLLLATRYCIAILNVEYKNFGGSQ